MLVTAHGITKEFGPDTRFTDIAAEFQEYYDNRILLAKIGEEVYELHKYCPGNDFNLEFITAKDKLGIMAYQRSCMFIMLKAFYGICKDVKDFEVIVDYTLGGGFYSYIHGDIELTQELLKKVEDRMHEIVKSALPIMKRTVTREKAIELFGEIGMHSKEHLFRYRISNFVNIYSIGKFQDYFYGYMLEDTSYCEKFKLLKYGEGFVLMMPEREDPEKIAEFGPMDKLYKVQKESSMWAEEIGVRDVGRLNDMIVKCNNKNLILMQEAYFEKTIGNIAKRIVEENKRIVLIAGPSSSGKTTFSKRLSIQLQALGHRPFPISVDNYFKARELAPRDENGNYDFESIKCVDTKKFNEDMLKLLRAEEIELPVYNFITGKREYRGDMAKLEKDDILVIEGIHCLNDEMSYALPNDVRFRIYISALTQINIDEHNRIPTTDARLIRRIVRDNRTRGYSAKNTIAMWDNVRRGEDKNIFPYQESADVMVNSAMIYELPVLKIFAVPLLFQIKENDKEYQEARRLLKFFDYFLPLSPESIPGNSIIREFIGGGCFEH